MADLESRIAEWKAHVARTPAVTGRDVDELEAHLRDQIDELSAAGLSPEEAFLVGVKRMGDVDELSREFARENSGRLWKQLVRDDDVDVEQAGGPSGWIEAVGFAAAAGLAVQVSRFGTSGDAGPARWVLRNAGFFVLPFLAAYFARRRRLGPRQVAVTAAPFAVLAVIANAYPYDADSATELLVALHLPVALWFATAVPYMGGALASHERRMDFVRFTGEWAIYYALLGLGGIVLLGLTGLILDPIDPELAERVIEWVLPSGAAGAVVIAAWLVESKQQVIENMAPVLTMVFTPLFAAMLMLSAVTYARSGLSGAFDRELVSVLDALLVVVLGLVLYGISARPPEPPPGWMDRVQLAAVVAALALDLMVLGTMLGRIGDLGVTPNRAAALGLNVVLLVNLAATAWLSASFLARRAPFHRVERWQTAYLPVFAAWVVAVVVALPPVFAFR